MSIHYYDPEDYELVSSRTTCSFHKRNPGVAYAGCCCSSAYSMQKKKDADKKSKKFVEIDTKTIAVLKGL